MGFSFRRPIAPRHVTKKNMKTLVYLLFLGLATCRNINKDDCITQYTSIEACHLAKEICQWRPSHSKCVQVTCEEYSHAPVKCDQIGGGKKCAYDKNDQRCKEFSFLTFVDMSPKGISMEKLPVALQDAQDRINERKQMMEMLRKQ